MSTPRDADLGASNERTALGWQRTALSLLAGCAAIARLTWTSLGSLVLLPLALAAALSAWVFLESRFRYAHKAGTRLRRTPRGGTAPLALTLATALLGLIELSSLLR